MLLAAQALETVISATPAPGSRAYSFTLELAGVAPGIQAPNANTSDKNGSPLREFCLLQTAAYVRAGQLKIRAQLYFWDPPKITKKAFFEVLRRV